LPSAYAGAAPEVSTVVAPPAPEVPTPEVPTRAITPPPSPPRVAAVEPVPPAPPPVRMTRGLTAIAAYWVVAQLYWLLSGLPYVREIPGVIRTDVDLIDFVMVVVPAIAISLGLLVAVLFWRRHRAFVPLLTAWLLLGALSLGYTLAFMLRTGYASLREPEFWLPGIVAIVAALVFVPHVWRTPSIRRMFTR
jgi:hypothetical protein